MAAAVSRTDRHAQGVDTIGDFIMSLIDRFRFRSPDKPVVRPPLEEIGGSGTAIFAGFISGEEYNNTLTGSAGRIIYDKMYRTDAQVAAAIRVSILPLMRATWSIDPHDPDDAVSVAIADAFRHNLFETLTHPWVGVLRELLKNMLVFGFMTFEEIWRFDAESGLYHWDRLAPRLPRTLYRWETSRNQLTGLTQCVTIDGVTQFPTIPAEKLLLFAHDQDGDNYEGTSALRQAYPAWYFKQNLWRIEAIAAERHGAGLPVLKYPPGLSESGKSKVNSMLAHLWAHEKQYLALNTDYQFELHGASGQLKSSVPFIQYLDKQIAKCVLAQFIETGTDGNGSYALHEDQSDLFLMNLEGIADHIVAVFQRDGIRQWVDINFGPQYPAPKLSYSGLRNKNIERYANSVKAIVEAGGVTIDAEIEDRLRALLDFPPKAEDEGKDEAQIPEGPGPEPEPEPPAKGYRGFSEVPRVGFRRELQRAEKYVEFEEIDKGLDSAVDQFVEAAKDVQQKQIDSLVEVAAKIIEGRKLDKIAEISVPYKAEMARNFAKTLREIYTYGRQTVKEEINRQRRESGKLSELREIMLAYEPIEPLGEAEAAVIQEYLNSKAAVSSDLMAGKLKASVSGEVLRQMQAGILDRAKLREVLESLSSKELKANGSVSISQAFNYGRRVQSKLFSKLIKRVQYSALLDENTCHACAAMDGEEWDFDDILTDKYAGGNPDCDGGPRCRCLLVYVTEAEIEAEK